MKKIDWLYGGGLVIVLFGLLILFATLFSPLLIIIGIILIAISRKPLRVKLATIFLPILLWFPFLKFMDYMGAKSNKLIILIPAEIKGPFKIIHSEPLGLEPTVENGENIFRLPSNRLLVIKPKIYLAKHSDFYLLYNNGNRVKLNVVKRSDTINAGIELRNSGKVTIA